MHLEVWVVVDGHAVADVVHAAEDGPAPRNVTATRLIQTTEKSDLQSPHETTIIKGTAYAAATQQQPLNVPVALIISTSSS